MTRRVRGKRSATTFVDGTTAATSMSCKATHREKCDGRNWELGELPMERPGAMSFQPSHPKPQPDGFALCRALPNVSRPLSYVASWLSAVPSGRAISSRPPGHLHRARVIPISNDRSSAAESFAISCIASITGPLPALARAIRRSSKLLCGQ